MLPLARFNRFFEGDGDLARHLRLGEWMVEHRALLLVDNFSFTKSGEPFLPFEWGSEVAFALAHRLAGLPGVAVFAALLIASTYALVVLFLRKRGVDPALALLVGLLAGFNGNSHWLARPHLFTFIGTTLLLFLLEGSRRRLVWPIAPLFVVWANLHGGFLFGLILIGIYLAGSIAESVQGSDRPASRATARYYARAFVLALAACLVNPFGVGLLAHVFGFAAGNTFIKRITHEFASPDFFEPGSKLFLVTMLALIAALIGVGKRPSYPRLLLILAAVGFALLHQRNISLFGLTALPVAALHLDSAWRSWSMPGLARFRRAAAQDERNIVGLWAAPIAVGMVVLALRGGVVHGATLIPDRFDADTFPVEAVERARAAGIEGRIFHDFGWGGYLLYAWPEQKVFIDGGTDFYGEELSRAYVLMQHLAPGWREALQRWNISLVLLSPHAILAHELVREPGWVVWYCDDTSVMLRRLNARSSGSAGMEARHASCLTESRHALEEVGDF
jgi:hypothetical protein